MTDRQGLDEPGLWPWQELYAEALVRTGRLGEAEETLEAWQAKAGQRGRKSALVVAARARGLLEDSRKRPRNAEEAFQAGLSQAEEINLPFDTALLRLVYGQWLRRAGRRAAGADELLRAGNQLQEMNASPFVDLAEQELTKCGVSPTTRTGPWSTSLTSQERSVAELVAAGKTNREVAATLQISPRTVAFHLGNVYSKLGVSNRTQLSRTLGKNQLS
jgi:DNA-binding CsgD family transcriptional regulator